MSDYDRRPHQGSHFNNRKRRFRDDDDNDRRGPRRRTDNAPPHIRLRRSLLHIADSSHHRWQDEAHSIANIVGDYYEDNTEVRTTFNELLFLITVEQPMKIPFLTYTLLVINTTKPTIVNKVLARLTDIIQDKIKTGEWRTVKLCLRVLACLQPILSGDGVFTLLDELFTCAGALQSESSDDTIGTEIVKIILITIPYIMAFSTETWKSKTAELMEKTDIIASEPHSLQSLVDPFLSNNGTDTGNGASIVALLQKQLQSEADNNWPLTLLPRPWIASSGDSEFQTRIEESDKHDIPAITIPEKLLQGENCLFPEIWFSVYSGQDVDTVPQTDSIASTVLRDVCLDTINNMNFNRFSSARAIIEIDNFFSHGTFAERETPYDQLRGLEDGQSTWKPEDVVVDAVFSQIFQLPCAQHKRVYYHSVLTEACKLAPAAIAPSMGRAIRYLYRHTANLDLELSQRFVNWFSHHVSNFGFTWKWQEWVDDVQFDESHPRKSFIIGAIDREIRLSFSQRIKGTLPEVYRGLIHRGTEIDEPEFKFADPKASFSAEGLDMAALLRKKTSEEDAFQPIIEKIQSAALDAGVDPLVASVDVLMTAVCFVGSKSLSHGIACLERARAKLAEFASASEAARAQLMSSIAIYWKYHPGNIAALIERLINMAVLTPAAVASWAITTPHLRQSEEDPASANLSRSLVFELVLNTVERVILHLHQPVEGVELKPTFEDLETLLSTIHELVDKVPKYGNEEGVESVATWKARWTRVFQRKKAEQQAIVAERKTAEEVKQKEEEALLKEAEADIAKNKAVSDE